MNEQLIKIIIKKIENDYKNDIALLVIYGSYVRGNTHDKSDIDFYIVPKTERGKELNSTFIINDIGYDLWSLSWESLESIARYDGMVSLVADGKVAYYSDEAELARFMELQKMARKPIDVDFSSIVNKHITKCKNAFYEVINASEFSSQKGAATDIIVELVFAISAINKTYTHSGWGKSVQEISNMKYVPTDFLDLCDEVVCSENSEQLINSVKLLINNTIELIPKHEYTDNISEQFSGFYEEEKSIYNKIYNACNTNDRITAIMGATSLKRDICSILSEEEYKSLGFPDIVACFNYKNLQEYKDIVFQHEKIFLDLLKANNVKINEYSSFEEFEKKF